MCADAHRGQRASDPLELKLQVIVRPMWVLGRALRPLEEQEMLLTSEPPLQPKHGVTKCCV